GRRDVDEDDAVGLALLRVGRRDEQDDIQSRDAEHRGGKGADARDAARERKEGVRRGEPEPAHGARAHSIEILRAAAIAQGAKASETISMAASSRSCDCAPSPAAAMSTLPAPMTRTGT